jgi:hypothetical protein
MNEPIVITYNPKLTGEDTLGRIEGKGQAKEEEGDGGVGGS